MFLVQPQEVLIQPLLAHPVTAASRHCQAIASPGMIALLICAAGCATAPGPARPLASTAALMTMPAPVNATVAPVQPAPIENQPGPHSSSAGQPRLFVPESRHEFGSVDAGQTVSHTFQLINTGTTALKIKEVRTTCGCTVADLDIDVLEPDEVASLTVRVAMGKSSGRRQRAVTVLSNDPNAPQLQLVMAADVQRKPEPPKAPAQQQHDGAANQRDDAPAAESAAPHATASQPSRGSGSVYKLPSGRSIIRRSR